MTWHSAVDDCKIAQDHLVQKPPVRPADPQRRRLQMMEVEAQTTVLMMLDRLEQGERFVIEALRATKLADPTRLHDAFHAQQLRDPLLDFGGNQVLRAGMFVLPNVKTYLEDEEGMSCDVKIGKRVEAMLWYCRRSSDVDVKCLLAALVYFSALRCLKFFKAFTFGFF